MRHLSISEVEKGLLDLAAVLADLSTVMEACGPDALARDISDIATQLQEGPEGWLRFVAEEMRTVLGHKTQLGADFHLLEAAWPAGHYHDAGLALGQMTGILLENRP